MRNIILRSINRVLALTLILSILGVGYLAFNMSHIYYTVTFSFGSPLVQQVALAPALDMAQLEPLPLRKPKVRQ